MKKTFLMLLLTIANCSFVIAQSGWFNVTTPINSLDLNRIQFTSANTGYSIGPLNGLSSGYLLKTTNGGSNWQSIYIDALWCWSLFFIDDSTGYIVGDNSSSPGIIKKTTNGGYNWVTQLIGLSNCYFTIYFIDYNTGYAGGKYNAVVKTTNGGINWISKPGAEGQEFNDIYFLNSNTGFVVGNTGKINKTTNGGDNWIQFSNGDYSYSSMYFVDGNTGYICTQNAVVFKTTNTGESWFYADSLSNPLFSIFFTNHNTGYTCAGRYIFKTTNGGFNWVSQMPDSALNIYFRSVFFINNNTGFIAGYDGIIMKTTNGGSVFVNNNSGDVPNKFSLSQNYPNPFNPTTRIRYALPRAGVVRLAVYDVMGREVEMLVNERQAAGSYEAAWDGSRFASGVYFYRLTAEGFNETRKMILIR